MRCHGTIAPALLFSVVQFAEGQYPGSLSFQFPGGNVYSKGVPVRVDLWLSFDPNPNVHAWNSWGGDIQCDDPTGLWDNLATPHTAVTLGTPVSGSIMGVHVFQVHFPPSGVFASTDNPIMIWSGEWSTTDLTPRTVTLSTSTLFGHVYVNSGLLTGLTLQEGTGEIQVIPSPVSVATLGLAVFAVRQRRRMALA
jgi:hypothetical protein